MELDILKDEQITLLVKREAKNRDRSRFRREENEQQKADD